MVLLLQTSLRLMLMQICILMVTRQTQVLSLLFIIFFNYFLSRDLGDPTLQDYQKSSIILKYPLAQINSRYEVNNGNGSSSRYATSYINLSRPLSSPAETCEYKEKYQFPATAYHYQSKKVVIY